MTKKEAFLMDLILGEFLKKENKTNYGLIDLNKVIANNKQLKNFKKEEVNDLLYLARLKQKDIPTLFQGSTLLSVNERSISDFLRNGGFKSIWKKERNKTILKWTTFLITVLTFILVVIQVFLQINFSETSKKEPLELKQKSKQLDEERKQFLSDSLGTRSYNPNQQTTSQSDSLE